MAREDAKRAAAADAARKREARTALQGQSAEAEARRCVHVLGAGCRAGVASAAGALAAWLLGLLLHRTACLTHTPCPHPHAVQARGAGRQEGGAAGGGAGAAAVGAGAWGPRGGGWACWAAREQHPLNRTWQTSNWPAACTVFRCERSHPALPSPPRPHRAAPQDEKAARARRRAEVDQLRCEREKQLEEQANRRQVAVELRRLGDAEASARVAVDVKRQIEVGGLGAWATGGRRGLWDGIAGSASSVFQPGSPPPACAGGGCRAGAGQGGAQAVPAQQRGQQKGELRGWGNVGQGRRLL